MARSTSPRPEFTAHGPARSTDATSVKPKESYRETVEAIAVAFILALLVRGFEAEAFVIPTGSMAPTLMGRHKEITCPQCSYVYTINASDEVEGVPSGVPAPRVESGICMNCRYQAHVAGEPSFKGDRILVMKFPYDLASLPGAGGPNRWDVVVFRYPEEPEVSYIKRLVGLPGETVRIWYGDIYIKKPNASSFVLEHRPLEHQQAMQMLVYDDSHRPLALKERPEWRRWASVQEQAWSEDPARPGTYQASSTAATPCELRYRHLVPEPEQWRAIERGDALPHDPRPTLITDFYSYNTSELARRESDNPWMQPHWVGDLTLSADVTIENATGTLAFQLIKGGTPYRVAFDLATGSAAVSQGDEEFGRAATALKGPGRHHVEFANVDEWLTVWVDGKAVINQPYRGTSPLGDEAPKHAEPTTDDLEPARIRLEGGAKATVSGLVLKRDIYYTQNPGYFDYGGGWSSRAPRTAADLYEMLADPRRVAELGPLGWSDYPLGSDRFLMMGDNSPRSKDSRGWSNGDLEWDTVQRQKWEVPRTMITGKAFCVYWPHGKPIGPDIRLKPDFRIPFRPYFERMTWIH